MTIHANSVECYSRLDVTDRKQDIIDLLKKEKRPLTDRQIAYALGFHDLNSVRPRISELKKAKILRESGKVYCPVTKKRVRLVELRVEIT